ncbi:MAG: protein-L-isoaspartate(D-aspartate) O-methyltransferase [Candidatus Brocadiia bacterium]|nr:MAG: protein-L-isoaspartate(D-aspartate) O-methyltransferase [Candidatus Brocadiia bacterium]
MNHVGRRPRMYSREPRYFRQIVWLMLSWLLLLSVFPGVVRYSKKAIGAAGRQISLSDPNESVPISKNVSDPNRAGEPEKDQSGKKEIRPPDHNHPAFVERADERNRMVQEQIKAPGRDVRDPNVLKVMRTVPRHMFVRPGDLRYAYADSPLEIGLGQTISQPYIVAYMTEALRLDPNDKVLEVGTGSGYQAAVCGEIAREVYTVEIIDSLASTAKKTLELLGYHNVFVRASDGYFGWAENGPFDAIIVTCVAGFVPPPLIEQLKPGGRMILPLGQPFGMQRLVLISKDQDGKILTRSMLPVRFVPMMGRITEVKK